MRKFDKVSARMSFSSKYCREVAENAMKPLIFMYHEAMSIEYIFWGLKVSLLQYIFVLSIFLGFKMSWI